MKVHIEFNVDNAAFVDDWSREVQSTTNQIETILNRLGRPDGKKKCSVVGHLWDTNGNTIGSVWFKEEET